MTTFRKGFTSAGGLLASALIVATAGNAFARGAKATTEEEKPAEVQNAVYNGVSCDHVRAKVAESGVTAAYAYARYMGLTSRDIARVRKACSV
jgi:hypothetical protein